MPGVPTERPNMETSRGNVGISVSNLDVVLGDRHVLDGISFTVREGEFLVIVGASGCGKSTLLNVLAGFITPNSGEIFVEGFEPTSSELRRGMVFQEYALFPWRTAWRNVAMPLEALGVPKEQRRRRALDLLDSVKLRDFADTYPHHMSGGMKQRVAIARALASEPSVLLMDEPLGALDALTREELMTLLAELWERTKLTVVYITHNVTEAVYLGDRVLVFSPGPRSVIAEDVSIDIERPRDALSEEAVEYQRRVTALVSH